MRLYKVHFGYEGGLSIWREAVGPSKEYRNQRTLNGAMKPKERIPNGVHIHGEERTARAGS